MRAQYHLTPFILSIYEIYQREIQKFTVIFTLIVERGSYDEIQRPQKAQQRYLKLFHVQTIQLNNSFLAKKKNSPYSFCLHHLYIYDNDDCSEEENVEQQNLYMHSCRSIRSVECKELSARKVHCIANEKESA